MLSRRLFATVVPLVLVFAASIHCAAADSAAPRLNVLFVAFDDLNDWIKPYDTTAPIAMPNLERVMRRGVTFRHAYCAAPECNPSRTSLLSGLAPVTTGIYANNSDWKAAMPAVVMLPHYFREHGYYSVGAGKIFHHVSRHYHDEASFDRYLPFVTDVLPDKKLNQLTVARAPDGEWEPLAPTFDWGVSPTAGQDMLDSRSADFAVRFLAEPHAKPFFLAVGFFRPHLPYFSPQSFLDRYPPAATPLPIVKDDDLDDVPSGALALMKRWRLMFRSIEQAPDANAKWHQAVAAYAAGATFADAQLGRILDALDASPLRDNTIIVVWSDHGYHLGEKHHWTKFVLWEKSTHVPLVIAAPGIAPANEDCLHPVSLLDLYPTLLDLCGLPKKSGLDGTSLVPLLRNPSGPSDRPILTTEMRGNNTIRTERWRFIHYVDGTEELYDHDNDPNEWINLAPNPDYHDIVLRLRGLLPKHEAPPAADYHQKGMAY